MNKRSTINRRQFIHAAAAVTGGLAAAQTMNILPLAAAPAKDTIARRVLGRTKLEPTLMTLGAAPFGIADDVPVDEGVEIVHAALDLGINSIDTAPRYGKSIDVVGKALGNRRKDIILASKVWADTIAEAEETLADSFKRLHTDYLDILYFHHLGERNVEMARKDDGVFTWLLKQKKAGKCRFVGISGHNMPGRFIPFLESGEVDVILIALNFVDRFTYDFETKVLPIAQKHNVGVVAMKVFGGPEGKSGSWGTRKALPMVGKENVALAIRYALSLPGVATANLGVHTADQLRQNVEIVKNFKPLSEEEQKKIAEKGRELAPQWGAHFGPAS
jgi:predicted aldo/keto reductase-like oxidoreductase